MFYIFYISRMRWVCYRFFVCLKKEMKKFTSTHRLREEKRSDMDKFPMWLEIGYHPWTHKALLLLVVKDKKCITQFQWLQSGLLTQIYILKKWLLLMYFHEVHWPSDFTGDLSPLGTLPQQLLSWSRWWSSRERDTNPTSNRKFCVQRPIFLGWCVHVVIAQQDNIR